MLATVIIPAFNSEATIRECLGNVLSQKGVGSFEVIVVDDGSTDKTAEIVKKFRKVKLIQQKNSGPAAARNKGVKQAKGEIVVFTDDDCIAEKGWLKEMLAPFNDSEVSGVQGSYKTSQPELIARFSQLEIEHRYKRLLKKKFIDFIGSYSAAYRKKDFLEAGGFDSKVTIASGEDPDFSFKLSEMGKKLVFTSKARVYHNHPDSIFQYLKIKFYRAFWRVRLYKKHSEKMIQDSYTPHLMKLRILLVPLFFALAGAGFFANEFWAFSIVLALIILASMIPLTIFAARRDFSAGLAAPFIMVAREISFALGLVAGLIAGVWRK